MLIRVQTSQVLATRQRQWAPGTSPGTTAEYALPLVCPELQAGARHQSFPTAVRCAQSSSSIGTLLNTCSLVATHTSSTGDKSGVARYEGRGAWREWVCTCNTRGW